MNHQHEWEYLYDDLSRCNQCGLIISSSEWCEHEGHIWSRYGSVKKCILCDETQDAEPLKWWLIQDDGK